MARYTHFDGISSKVNGFAVGAQGSEVSICSQAGVLAQAGEPLRAYTKKISIGFADGTTETDTGWDVPSNAVVLGVYVNVTTAEATGADKTIDVGTGGTSDDPNGFLDGVSVASTGLVKGTLANGAVTLGALLKIADGTTDVPEPNVSAAGDSVTWTPGSNDFAELAADIYFVYVLLS